MSKLLLHYQTSLGPRTIIAEVADRDSAQAVCNAHLALGERASLVEEMPRLSIKDHMAKHKRTQARAKKLTVIEQPSNVTPIRKARRGS